jgi:hypothetical protein
MSQLVSMYRIENILTSQKFEKNRTSPEIMDARLLVGGGSAGLSGKPFRHAALFLETKRFPV